MHVVSMNKENSDRVRENNDSINKENNDSMNRENNERVIIGMGGN